MGRCAERIRPPRELPGGRSPVASGACWPPRWSRRCAGGHGDWRKLLGLRLATVTAFCDGLSRVLPRLVARFVKPPQPESTILLTRRRALDRRAADVVCLTGESGRWVSPKKSDFIRRTPSVVIYPAGVLRGSSLWPQAGPRGLDSFISWEGLHPITENQAKMCRWPTCSATSAVIFDGKGGE